MDTTLRQSNSEMLFRRAKAVMPGGNTRASVFWTPCPIYMESGAGARVWDTDGNVYLDFDNNFTSLIHGHGFAPVVEAIRKQSLQGLSFGAPTKAEIELAELLCARLDFFDHVRFMNTGTEAVMNAIKAARAFTGRPKIAKFEGAYHGSYDPVQVSLAPSPEQWGKKRPRAVPHDVGTPSALVDETVVLPFNDLEGTREILRESADELAAVLIDPMPSQAGLIPVDSEFLRFLRSFTQERGVLLVSDEVLNFRLGWSGAMAHFGVVPDLCAFGKIIGGGLPIGAVAGRAKVMEIFDPSHGKPQVFQAGTFTANPLSMVAGRAAMAALTQQEFDRLNNLGDYARKRLSECFLQSGVSGQVTGTGSVLRLHFKEKPLRNYRDAYATPEQRARLRRLVEFARHNGVLLPQSGLATLSTPMEQKDIDQFAEVVLRGLQIIKQSMA